MPDAFLINSKCDNPPVRDALLEESSCTDSRLVQAALDGDKQAYSLLFSRHRKTVFSMCLDFSRGDSAQAHDLCQEAFISAFRELGQLRDHSRFIGWLKEIARNKCISFVRKQRTHNTMLKDYQVIAQIMTKDDREWSVAELQVVEDVINGLGKPDFKETIRLFYLEGKSTLDIAEIQGISQTLVTTRLNRFRTRFRKRIMQEILKLRATRSGNDMQDT